MEESENKHVFDELASQEHIRALETQVSVLSTGIVGFPASLFWRVRHIRYPCAGA
jgi:hypothetical protein